MDIRIVSICERTIHLGFSALFLLMPLLVCPLTYELFEFPKILFVYVVTVVIAAGFLIKMVVLRAYRKPCFEQSREVCFEPVEEQGSGFSTPPRLRGRSNSRTRWSSGFLLNTKYQIPDTIWFLKSNPLFLPIFLYLLFFTLSTLFSTHPYTSVFGYYSRFHGGLLSLICYVSLFFIYIAEFRNRPKKMLSLVRCLSSAALLVSLYGVLQHFGIDRDYWVQDSQARVFSTLGQPNWLAAWLLMVLPLSWVFYFSSRFFLLDTCYLLLSTLLFASFWFTYSLSGLLGFAVVVTAFLLLAPRKILSENRGKLALLVICYLLLAASCPGLFAPRVRSVWESLTAGGIRPALADSSVAARDAPPLQLPGGDTAEIRRIVWRGSLDLWKSSPKNMLLGTGPETFAYNFLPFRPVELNQTSEWEFLYNRSHNEYLDILCNTGILGLGSYLFLVGMFLWWGIEKVQSSKFKVQNSKFKGSRLRLSTSSRLRSNNNSLYSSSLPRSMFRACREACFEQSREARFESVEKQSKLATGRELKVQSFRANGSDLPLMLNTKYLILDTRYLLPALLSGWVSLLVTNFFGFSVVPTAFLFWLYPAICYAPEFATGEMGSISG